jgi:hypothetical protein
VSLVGGVEIPIGLKWIFIPAVVRHCQRKVSNPKAGQVRGRQVLYNLEARVDLPIPVRIFLTQEFSEVAQQKPVVQRLSGPY